MIIKALSDQFTPNAIIHMLETPQAISKFNNLNIE